MYSLEILTLVYRSKNLVEMQHVFELFPLTENLLFADYDDYLDDDDLDLIEENLGVKVKRRVRIIFHCYFLCVITISTVQLQLDL